MKIVQMTVENIMKVKAAFIKPSDNLIMIQGENESGKSSILAFLVDEFQGIE